MTEDENLRTAGPHERTERAISYTVRISGPGMDSVVAINETDDLDILDVILKKVRRQMSAAKHALTDSDLFPRVAACVVKTSVPSL